MTLYQPYTFPGLSFLLEALTWWGCGFPYLRGSLEEIGVRGWEAGPNARSELARSTHHPRSELEAPLLRLNLNLSGVLGERSAEHLQVRDAGDPPGPRPPETQAEEDRDPARSLPRAGGAAPRQLLPPAARQGSVAARGSAGGSYDPVLSAPLWPAPPACCGWRSCCSGRWIGPAPAPR